jgi:hypothetical protein
VHPGRGDGDTGVVEFLLLCKRRSLSKSAPLPRQRRGRGRKRAARTCGIKTTTCGLLVALATKLARPTTSFLTILFNNAANVLVEPA